VRDGHEFSASQIRQRNDQTNKDWAEGKVFFKEPYDPKYMGDYTFEPPQTICPACAAGSQAVRFASTIRDAQHGNGVMYIDPQSGRVLKLSYIPNALPPHATSGTVTEIGGQALPHLWYVVRITELYRGHAFVFNGTGIFTGTFDHFRRLSSLTAARAALQNQTI
jgi:hypothetical protein